MQKHHFRCHVLFLQQCSELAFTTNLGPSPAERQLFQLHCFAAHSVRALTFLLPLSAPSFAHKRSRRKLI